MEQEEILALQICAAMEYNNWNDICEVHKKEEKLTITTKSVKIVKESKDLEELEESGKGTLESIAEPEEGTNWIALRDSGWFEAYSDFTDTVSKADTEENYERAEQRTVACLSTWNNRRIFGSELHMIALVIGVDARAHLHQFAMQMNHLRRTGTLMQIVNILSHHCYII